MCLVWISAQTAIISLYRIQCIQECPPTCKLVHGFPWSSPDIPNAQLAFKSHATLRDCHVAFRKLTSQFPPNAALTTSSKFRHNDSCQAWNSPPPPKKKLTSFLCCMFKQSASQRLAFFTCHHSTLPLAYLYKKAERA